MPHLFFFFDYSILTHRMLGLQPLLTVISVCPLSRNDQGISILAQLMDRCLISHLFNTIWRDPVELSRQGLIFYEVCGECDREDRMLLCDKCNFGCHLECLDPPLNISRSDIWLCHYCVLYKLIYLAEENMALR